MTTHEVVRATVKMTGLALFIYGATQALSTLPLVFENASHSELSMSVLSYVAAMGGPVLFGIILWLLPSKIANTIVRMDVALLETDQRLIAIETIAIRVMGVFLLYHCISDLVSNCLSYMQATSMKSAFSSFGVGNKYSIGFYVIGIETVMAIGLILGSKGIANIVRKIRYAS